MQTAQQQELWQRMETCLRKIDAYPDPAVWIARFSRDMIESQIERIRERQQAGIDQPLLGMTFAVKDNIDVLGLPTTAACPEFAYEPEESATVVGHLCDAGAIVLGKTNLDQFATGLVGTRSPYGACRNVFKSNYISGGSSSGSAVAVAAGLVDFALGTDTAGSGRVPASFNNIVGLKPTRGLLSNFGVVPACRSLDCVSIFARDCATAARVFREAEGFDVRDIFSRRASDLPSSRRPEPEHAFVFGTPAPQDLEFFGNDEMRRLYTRAIERAIGMGGQPVTIDFRPFVESAKLLYDGPWVAERLVSVGEFYHGHPEALLPILRTIIGGAQRFSAVDAYQGLYRLQAAKRAIELEWSKIDVLLLPTAGTIYTIAQVNAEPLALNRNLGYYTNFVNLLDLSALSVPAGFMPCGLPGGVTLIAPAGADELLIGLGERFEKAGEPS